MRGKMGLPRTNPCVFLTFISLCILSSKVCPREIPVFSKKTTTLYSLPTFNNKGSQNRFNSELSSATANEYKGSNRLMGSNTKDKVNADGNWHLIYHHLETETSHGQNPTQTAVSKARPLDTYVTDADRNLNQKNFVDTIYQANIARGVRRSNIQSQLLTPSLRSNIQDTFLNGNNLGIDLPRTQATSRHFDNPAVLYDNPLAASSRHGSESGTKPLQMYDLSNDPPGQPDVKRLRHLHTSVVYPDQEIYKGRLPILPTIEENTREWYPHLPSYPRGERFHSKHDNFRHEVISEAKPYFTQLDNQPQRFQQASQTTHKLSASSPARHQQRFVPTDNFVTRDAVHQPYHSYRGKTDNYVLENKPSSYSQRANQVQSDSMAGQQRLDANNVNSKTSIPVRDVFSNLENRNRMNKILLPSALHVLGTAVGNLLSRTRHSPDPSQYDNRSNRRQQFIDANIQNREMLASSGNDLFLLADHKKVNEEISPMTLQTVGMAMTNLGSKAQQQHHVIHENNQVSSPSHTKQVPSERRTQQSTWQTHPPTIQHSSLNEVPHHQQSHDIYRRQVKHTVGEQNNRHPTTLRKQQLIENSPKVIQNVLAAQPRQEQKPNMFVSRQQNYNLNSPTPQNTAFKALKHPIIDPQSQQHLNSMSPSPQPQKYNSLLTQQHNNLQSSHFQNENNNIQTLEQVKHNFLTSQQEKSNVQVIPHGNIFPSVQADIFQLKRQNIDLKPPQMNTDIKSLQEPVNALYSVELQQKSLQPTKLLNNTFQSPKQQNSNILLIPQENMLPSPRNIDIHYHNQQTTDLQSLQQRNIIQSQKQQQKPHFQSLQQRNIIQSQKQQQQPHLQSLQQQNNVFQSPQQQNGTQSIQQWNNIQSPQQQHQTVLQSLQQQTKTFQAPQQQLKTDLLSLQQQNDIFQSPPQQQKTDLQSRQHQKIFQAPQQQQLKTDILSLQQPNNVFQPPPQHKTDLHSLQQQNNVFQSPPLHKTDLQSLQQQTKTFQAPQQRLKTDLLSLQQHNNIFQSPSQQQETDLQSLQHQTIFHAPQQQQKIGLQLFQQHNNVVQSPQQHKTALQSLQQQTKTFQTPQQHLKTDLLSIQQQNNVFQSPPQKQKTDLQSLQHQTILHSSQQQQQQQKTDFKSSPTQNYVFQSTQQQQNNLLSNQRPPDHKYKLPKQKTNFQWLPQENIFLATQNGKSQLKQQVQVLSNQQDSSAKYKQGQIPHHNVLQSRGKHRQDTPTSLFDQYVKLNHKHIIKVKPGTHVSIRSDPNNNILFKIMTDNNNSDFINKQSHNVLNSQQQKKPSQIETIQNTTYKSGQHNNQTNVVVGIEQVIPGPSAVNNVGLQFHGTSKTLNTPSAQNQNTLKSVHPLADQTLRNNLLDPFKHLTDFPQQHEQTIPPQLSANVETAIGLMNSNVHPDSPSAGPHSMQTSLKPWHLENILQSSMNHGPVDPVYIDSLIDIFNNTLTVVPPGKNTSAGGNVADISQTTSYGEAPITARSQSLNIPNVLKPEVLNIKKVPLNMSPIVTKISPSSKALATTVTQLEATLTPITNVNPSLAENSTLQHTTNIQQTVATNPPASMSSIPVLPKHQKTPTHLQYSMPHIERIPTYSIFLSNITSNKTRQNNTTATNETVSNTTGSQSQSNERAMSVKYNSSVIAPNESKNIQASEIIIASLTELMHQNSTSNNETSTISSSSYNVTNAQSPVKRTPHRLV